MATITVEGIPDALVARLAIAAAGNGRCLNSEVIVRLARAAGPTTQPPDRGPGFPGGGCGGGHGCLCGGRNPGIPATVGWGGPASRQPRA